MKELNELVELAKKATSGEWNAFIATGGDGTFSIHTPDDSRKGNVVNWPGFDTANCSKAQKKANAKYIAAAHPDAILAITEAYLALEQRAEAAEAKSAKWKEEAIKAHEESEIILAKLTEMEKQPPVGEAVSIGGAIMVEWERCISDGTQLFTRPAPAINLAELVPGEMTFEHAIELCRERPGVIAKSFQEGANFTLSAILKNIEVSK